MADTSAASQPLSIRNLTDAGRLAEKRKEMENLRTRDKIDWTLNREFYKGNQWTFWNKNWPGGGRLENQPVDEGDKPHYKVRLTVADLQDQAQHYIAQLTKNKPVIYGTPDSGSDRDLKAAQMGTALLEYWWVEFALEAKLQTALLDANVSQGYWHISWDSLAGKMLNFMVGPDGQPLVGNLWDDDNLDIFRDELRNANVDPKMFERTVGVGDIAVRPIPGENVLLDPSTKTFEDARFAFVEVHMDVDELQARWPRAKDGTPTSAILPDAIPADQNFSTQGMPFPSDERPKTVRRVYYGYFRPGPVLPKGRHVIWIEDPNLILEDTDWQLPFNELPLAHFPGIEKPNSALDIPRMTAARPLAKELNRTVSQVVEHKNLTLKPQVLAPTGSLADRLTNEPGRTIFYNPINGAIPQWRDIPQLPQYVFGHLDRVEQKLDRLFNRMPTQRDQLPARIDSAGSIDTIHEATADQITPVIRRLEASLVRAGTLMVKLAQKYYIEERLLKIKGPNGAVQVRKFMNADLEGGFSFHAEAGSGLPRTRAGRQARIEFMLQSNLIDQRTALKYLDTADMTGLMAKMQSAEEQAYRTVEKIKQGQPVNVLGLQQAQAQVQAMMMDPNADPDGDGMPDPPQAKAQAAQQMLMQGALSPLPHEDPQVHLDVLTVFMDSVEFESLDPQIQQMFVTRYELMIQRWAEISQATATMQAPIERPKVAVQLKATSSAPVMAEILNDAGVQVTPEDVAAPPLDTWVSDDVTAPAVQETGNTHLDAADKVAAMAQRQEQHAMQMAKASHEVALASARSQDAHQQGDQQDAQGALERHAQAQKIAHAQEMHKARLRQAAQPPQRPVKSGR